MSERLLAERKAELATGTARMLLQRLETEGYKITVDADGHVKVSPRPGPDLVRELVKAKPELVSLLWRRQDPEAPVK